MVRKLKNLKENNAAVENLRAKLISVMNETASQIQTYTISCSTFGEKIYVALNLISQDPASGKISHLILPIVDLYVNCSSEENNSLSLFFHSLTTAKAAIAEDETSVQTTLQGI